MEPAADRGVTSVEDRAVRRIAGRAAAEAIEGGEEARRVGLSRRGRTARLSLDVRLPYPGDLTGSGELIRRHVTGRTEELTGLSVARTRVLISRLVLRSGAGAQEWSASPATGADTDTDTATDTDAAGAPDARAPGRAVRPWSARRAFSALVAAVLTVAAGALLADLVSVRAGGTAADWRRSAFDRLNELRIGESWASWFAVGVAALGLWCVLLALTPGLRGRLPLSAPSPRLRATLDRSGAAALLRDAVLAQNGVTYARVRTGRRRARVRVRVGFGELEHVGEDVQRALAQTVEACGFARPLRWRVRLVADANWRAPGASSQPPDVEATAADAVGRVPLTKASAVVAAAPADPGQGTPEGGEDR